MSFTVVPLNNLVLPTGTCIPLGPKFVLRGVPAWLKNDKQALSDLDWNERQRLKDAKFALIAEYEADSYGFPDPDWNGPKPRSIQDLRFESAFLANIALWLRQPSIVSFTSVFHALTTLNGRIADPPIVVHTDREGPFFAHPNDQSNPFELKHVVDAAKLYELLKAVPRKTTVWASLRALSAALLSYFPDHRFPLLWQALESLFGDETKTWKVTERLCSRISYFLARDTNEQHRIATKAQACFAVRSKIVHGRLADWSEVIGQMADTEAIVRTAVRSVLQRPGMLQIFISPERDEYLDRWVSSKEFVTPPIPT